VVAQEHVHAIGILALESAEKIEKLVRLVTPGGIHLLAVNHLLEDQMALGILVKGRGLVNRLKVPQMPVKVAGDQDIGRVLKLNESPLATGRVADLVAGFVDGSEEAVGVRHRAKDSRKLGKRG
jgi:hypothetical protein